jgi:hypothetical protein
MGNTRKSDRSVAASGQAAKELVKAAADERKAEGKLDEASRTLRAALAALTEAKAGSSSEKKARKAVRAAIDVLVTAKRKLKKRKKAVAKQMKTKARTEATATPKPKSQSVTKQRAARPTPRSGSKPRHAKTIRPIPKPDEKKIEDRQVAQAAEETSTDTVADGVQREEMGHANF